MLFRFELFFYFFKENGRCFIAGLMPGKVTVPQLSAGSVLGCIVLGFKYAKKNLLSPLYSQMSFFLV